MKKIRIHADSVNKQVFFNILSTMIISGIGFLTTPIFTRLLGTVQYGKYAVFYSWVTIITCMMGLHTQTSISTGIYDYRDDYYRFRSGVLLIGTILSVIIIAVLLVFSGFISEWMGYTIPVFLLVIASGYSHYMVDFARISMIYEKKAMVNFLLSSTLAVVTVLLSFFMINRFPEEERFLSRAFGVTIPYCVCAFILFILLYFRHPVLPKREYWKYSMLVGTPIIFHELSNKVLGQADLIMLERIGGIPEEVGIYSFFHTYTSVLTVILTALNTSWLPFFFDDLSRNELLTLKRKTKHYLELFTLICAVYILMSREVSYLFADISYFGGMNLIPIFTISVYFIFMYYFSVNVEIFKKKTGIIALGTFSTAIVNIILNALLIPVMGMFGAAIATAISYLGLFIAHYIIALHLQEGKPYVTIFDFIKWLSIIIASCLSFYLIKDLILLRWIIAFGTGALCIWHIVKRRTIF